MKKALALILAFVLVIGASVAGTLAYLTSTDEVVNTFTVGKVQLKLDEANVDEDGKLINHERVKENDYKLMPGHEYIKDPTVTVLEGSEESYVRMLVTFNNIDNLDEVFDDNSITDIFVGYDSSKWKWAGQKDNDNGTRTYEFRYFETVKPTATQAEKLEPLFTHVKLSGDINNDQLAMLADTTLTVTAEAIQADGFADANAAWAAFTK